MQNCKLFRYSLACWINKKYLHIC